MSDRVPGWSRLWDVEGDLVEVLQRALVASGE